MLQWYKRTFSAYCCISPFLFLFSCQINTLINYCYFNFLFTLSEILIWRALNLRIFGFSTLNTNPNPNKNTLMVSMHHAFQKILCFIILLRTWKIHVNFKRFLYIKYMWLSFHLFLVNTIFKWHKWHMHSSLMCSDGFRVNMLITVVFHLSGIASSFKQ